MKTGRSLLELAQEIDRQKAAKADLVVPTERVSMDPEVGLGPDPKDLTALVVDSDVEAGVLHESGGRAFPLRPLAHDQLADRLKIPRTYYRRMLENQPDLLADNVNRWLHEEPSTNLLRTLDGAARAWLSNRYRPLDNDRLIEFLGPIFERHAGSGLEVKSCEITERRLYLKCVYPALEGEITKGDVVQSGFVVTNSEVGASALSVYPFVLRLVCTNGMKIESAGKRRHHVGRVLGAGDDAGQIVEYREDTQRADDRAVMLKMRDVVEACLDPVQFDSLLDEFRVAAGSGEIANPERGVEVLAKQLRLTDAERSSVLTHLLRSGDLSAWGAANAVTRASADVRDYDRASELEAAGYSVVEMTQRDGGRPWEAVRLAA